MPKVEVKLWDVERIAETPLSLEELGKILEMLKGDLEEVRGDTIVYEASHDRPDMFSAEGLGRAVGVYKGSRKPVKYVIEDSTTYLDVSKAPEYRPYAYLAIVENLELDEEAVRQIFQLQEKLHATYCGDRELVSVGLYDLDKVKPPIRYVEVENASYRPLGYDSIMSLDEILRKTEKGLKYAHLVRHRRYPLLVDSEGQVLSFPPILNAEDNKVTEETRRVVIDVTGTEPHLMMKVLNIVTTSVSERSRNPVIKKVSIKGASLFPYSPVLEESLVEVKRDYVTSLLGIDPIQVKGPHLLESMGYEIQNLSSESIVVRVPPYRIDVLSYVDVIEDLAISYGYNEFSSVITPPPHFGGVNSLERFAEYLREVMLGLGLQEVLNFMLTDPDILSLVSDEDFVRVKNPKMKTYSAVRNSLIPAILTSVKTNSSKRRKLEIFEVGDVVRLSEGGQPTYTKKLAYGLAGDGYTLTDGLVVLKSLMKTLGINYELRRTSRKALISGRTAEVFVKGESVGIVGEVSPEILISLNILVPITVAEVDLVKLFSAL
ncbi:MAG: phenylalanine--tRNA ligase subunit beta, partial [Zestosphaera sp.]